MPRVPAATPASPATTSPVKGAARRFPYPDIFSVAVFFLALYIADLAHKFDPLMGRWLFIAIPLLAILALHGRQQIQQARERGLWPGVGERETIEHVKGLAQAGEKKLAIKLYRQIHHGASVSNAKAAVETLTSTTPTETSPAQAIPTRFPYSDLVSVAMFFLALFAVNNAILLLFRYFMPGIGLLIGILLIGISYGILWKGWRFTVKQLHVQQARGRGLWPHLGELATLDQVKGLAQAGEKKLAINLYRQIHRVSLANAKTAVEKLTG
jgi:ribosomal protein L7/L12